MNAYTPSFTADDATRRDNCATYIAARLARARRVAATAEYVVIRDDALAQIAHYTKLNAILETAQ
jgi:hypothetical protein